jgi:Protein of unknown function (DUF3172)
MSMLDIRKYVLFLPIVVAYSVPSMFSSYKMDSRLKIVDRQQHFARRRMDDFIDPNENFDDELDDDDDDAYYYEMERRRRNKQSRQQQQQYDDLGQASNRPQDGLGIPSPFGRRKGFRLPDSVSNSVLAGIFVLGIGLGVTIDSAINTNPRDLASRDAIDQAAPNANLCATYGASAMAFDQRVFVSFNPFNVFVAQADVKPACVLRQSNVVSVLRDRHLVNDEEIRSCKQNMNTWAFVGNLEDQPQLSCVYQSADAQNEFLSNPKLGIGEDVWDDDRATGKIIKGGLTSGQKDAIKQAAKNNPGSDN